MSEDTVKYIETLTNDLKDLEKTLKRSEGVPDMCYVVLPEDHYRVVDTSCYPIGSFERFPEVIALWKKLLREEIVAKKTILENLKVI